MQRATAKQTQRSSDGLRHVMTSEKRSSQKEKSKPKQREGAEAPLQQPPLSRTWPITMGPAPMIMIVLISVRRGIVGGKSHAAKGLSPFSMGATVATTTFEWPLGVARFARRARRDRFFNPTAKLLWRLVWSVAAADATAELTALRAVVVVIAIPNVRLGFSLLRRKKDHYRAASIRQIEQGLI